jgi:hypothetical protein
MPAPAGHAQIGRLALREEGAFWNAYWAPTETMKDSILLGSILMSVVGKNAALKQQFMDTMRDALGEAIYQEFGIRPAWGGPEKAPEHERSGHG